MAVIYGIISIKRVPVCVALQVITMITYTRYLFGSTVLTLWPLSIAMLAVIMIVGYDLYLQMREREVTSA